MSNAPSDSKALAALDRVDDFIARCNGDDRGSCADVNLLRAVLTKPELQAPRHKFWGAGEPDCPPELLAPNGELRSMRCKVCGDGWRRNKDACLGALSTMTEPKAQALDDALLTEVLYGVHHGWPSETLQRLDAIAERIQAQRMAAASAPSQTQAGGVREAVYVAARQCDDCDHIGINDEHEDEDMCSSCGWHGPSPDEDKCPSCGETEVMRLACPKCGGRYSLLTETRLPATPSPEARDPLKAMPEQPHMPECWSVAVGDGSRTLVSIGHNWLSGEPGLTDQDEQTIVGAAKHLLSFVGYGLPPSDFAPEARETAEPSGHAWAQGIPEEQCTRCGALWSTYPGCGACPGNGSICSTSCKLKDESPPFAATPPVEKLAEPAAITAWRAAKAKHIEATAAYNAALDRAKITDASRGFGFTNVNDEFQTMTAAANAAHRLQAAALDALYAAPVSQAEPSTPRLRAAASQARFALRELLPNDPDAQMTVRMLDEALNAARASHEEKGQG